MPDWIDGDPVELRAWRDAQPEAVDPILPDDVTLTHEADGGILCRPAQARPGGILHFHGGGFVVGSPWTHRAVGAWIAHVSQLPVWLCPWPLAPEHQLPAQPIAAAAALGAAADRWPGGLVLSGDSAGAMMAAWAYAWAAPGLRGRVRSLVTIYGAFGGMVEGGSEEAGLGPRSLRAMYRRLDPEGRIRNDPALDPLDPAFAVPGQVTVIAAEHDPLHAESVTFASRHAGAVLMTELGAGHGFLSAARSPVSASSVLHEAFRL